MALIKKLHKVCRYQRIVFRHKLYQLREERDMKTETFANLVSAILYEKRLLDFFYPDVPWHGQSISCNTIIECLKLSCTGELPPNDVTGEIETKGHIKLRFKTTVCIDVFSIRSFQLTQKASKMEYKAIESVLQTINTQTGECKANDAPLFIPYD
ncbi:hypothetical protein ACFE04_005845 [Oxalis oulophora]